jgi:subtilase family serine protease
LTTQRYTSPDRQNSNNVTSPGRVLPDISLDADSTTGVLVGQTQSDVDGKARYSEFRIGGTSVSSPLFGGLMALAIQYNGGGSLGFVSPALYAASIKSPDAFRDPFDHQPINVRTDYTNTQNPQSPVFFHLRLLGQLSSLHALPGYDDSTGLGSPCASAFIPAIVAPNIAMGAGPGCGAPLT